MLVYNDKESLTTYLNKAEIFKELIQNTQYNNILKFINDIFDLDGDDKFKSLRDFKNITNETLVKNTDFYNSIINKHKKILKINLVNITEKSEIFNIIKNIASPIGYKLVIKKRGKNIYYYLKN